MTGLTFATLLCAATVAAGTDSYTDSYADAKRQAEKGRPMLILVSTEWCAPCREMKNRVIPEVKRRGLLKKVAFAIINPDHDQEVAHQLTGGNPAIPQLIMYRKTSTGWMRKKLVGGQSVDTVEKFIKKGIPDEGAAEKDAAT